MQTSGAVRRENAAAYPVVIARETGAAQYSRALIMESKSCGVLDTPLSPSMTIWDGEALSVTTNARGIVPARPGRRASKTSRPVNPLETILGHQ